MNRTIKFIWLTFVVTYFSLNAIAQDFERKEDKVIRKGVDIAFSEQKAAAFTVGNQAGDRQVRVAGSIQKPVMVDGHKVYAKPIKQPKLKNRQNNLHDHIFSALDSELRKLPDGDYRLKLRDVMFGKDNRVVFFGYEGIRSADGKTTITLDQQQAIFKMLCFGMENVMPAGTLEHTPAFADDADLWDARFQVYNHEIYYHPEK